MKVHTRQMSSRGQWGRGDLGQKSMATLLMVPMVTREVAVIPETELAGKSYVALRV